MDLVGRDAERALLLARLGAAVAGRGSAVVVRGPGGIGKTVLLEDLAAQAGDVRVLRAMGVEFEADLPFAGLAELTRPLFRLVEELPTAQATAFASAVSDPGPARPTVDRFMVYAAVLSLLSAGAGNGPPLLCLIDDAQWLDAASGQALLFAARRLLAERVLVVFAARDVPGFDAPGLETVTLGGLGDRDGRALLAHAGVRSPGVVPALLSAADGNPLALTELPKALSARQRAGQEPLDEQLPITDRLERTFAAQLAARDDDELLALLLCAVGGSEGSDRLEQALARLGLSGSALDRCVADGLLRFEGPLLVFRHPLIRSAVYGRSGPGRRRRVHAALADVATVGGDADRAAWHRAGAATAPDDDVAQALAETGERARRRGGLVAQARALERAAELTLDPEARAGRRRAAVSAWISAGAVEHATRLLAADSSDPSSPTTLPPPVSARERCLSLQVRAYLAMLRGEIEPMVDDMVAEARRSAAEDPRAAGVLLSMAMNGPLGRWDVDRILAICEEAMHLVSPEGPAPTAPKIAARLAYARIIGARPGGDELARACIPVCLSAEVSGAGSELAEVLTWIEDDEPATRLLDRDVGAARADGDISLLAYSLPLRAQLRMRTGQLVDAYADALEGVELARAMGQRVNTAEALVVLAQVEAWTGRARDCAAHAEEAVRLAPHANVETRARRATGHSALAAGRFTDSAADLARAEQLLLAGGVAEPAVVPVAGDLVEALVRGGRPEARGTAAEATARLVSAAAHGSSARRVVRATACRSLALLADSAEQAEHHLREALRHLDGVAAPLDLARTRLVYGRRLRRMRRRADARAELEQAHDLFRAAGAGPWAAQAEFELAPANRPRARSEDDPVSRLTAHEWRIAHAAAQGLTSREIAERMLLSVRTVDHHLGTVYRTLGIRSRRELMRRLTPPGANP